MFYSNNPLIKHKTGLLNLAEELGNISQACKVMGMSRDTFYRYQQAVEQGGVEALLNQNRRVPNLKNRVDEAIEQAVVKFALDNPAFGQVRVSNELRKQGIFVSAGGVRSIWLRHHLRLTASANGYHKTILQEFYQVAFRKKIYTDLTTLQADLDEWLMYYNHHRTHQGKMCCGRTPMATLLDGKRIWVEKNLSSN
ncbi:DNA binding protein [Mannheimia phage vB_MhM_1127AP1]|uniref:Transposase n=1 Tax=Mannheimia phage vB_MhM_1127AP1 TaxID=1572746 RepID=A0A0M3LQE2_9CAUD|nr:DNA binding protein [Mannheimia phage vB_MhM_1127AP1]AJA73102.1 transposase [Mannheimia phage vB_MhM_1127AP1]